MKLASHSWEFGTASEALLELYTPELSVFGTPFPIPKNPSSPALDYAKRNISTDSDQLVDGDGLYSYFYDFCWFAENILLQALLVTQPRLVSLQSY